jgi:hypothetical protein
MDASPEHNPVCLRLIAVCVGHRLPELNDSAQCIDGAVELGKRTIAGKFDHTPATSGDGRPHALGKMYLQKSVSAAFIPTHQARVAHDVYGDDNRESALIAGQWHFLPLPHQIIGSALQRGNGNGLLAWAILVTWDGRLAFFGLLWRPRSGCGLSSASAGVRMATSAVLCTCRNI